LRGRADPLLRADLPARSDRPDHTAPVFAAPVEPGSLHVRVAVALDGGLLIAAGERGLLLLTLGGRVRARWDLAADRLIVADHGGVVIIVTEGERISELHRLDLHTRRLAPIATIDGQIAADSFDGGTLVLLRGGELLGVDITSRPLHEVWSEFGASSAIYAVTRTATSMSALVNVPLHATAGGRSTERWTWELPMRRLRTREPGAWELDGTANYALTADGTLLWSVADERGLVESWC